METDIEDALDIDHTLERLLFQVRPQRQVIMGRLHVRGQPVLVRRAWCAHTSRSIGSRWSDVEIIAVFTVISALAQASSGYETERFVTGRAEGAGLVFRGQSKTRRLQGR